MEPNLERGPRTNETEKKNKYTCSWAAYTTKPSIAACKLAQTLLEHAYATTVLYCKGNLCLVECVVEEDACAAMRLSA